MRLSVESALSFANWDAQTLTTSLIPFSVILRSTEKEIILNWDDLSVVNPNLQHPRVDDTIEKPKPNNNAPSATMKSRIAIAALAYQLVLAISTNAAAATAQHDHPERYYADAVEELEHEIIGSGIHGDGASEGGDRKSKNRRNHNQHHRRAAAAPSQQQNSEEIKGYKKKIDKRKAERERIAREDIQKLNDRLQHATNHLITMIYEINFINASKIKRYIWIKCTRK